MHFVKFCLLYTKNTLENIFLNFWIMVIQQLYNIYSHFSVSFIKANMSIENSVKRSELFYFLFKSMLHGLFFHWFGKFSC